MNKGDGVILNIVDILLPWYNNNKLLLFLILPPPLFSLYCDSSSDRPPPLVFLFVFVGLWWIATTTLARVLSTPYFFFPLKKHIHIKHCRVTLLLLCLVLSCLFFNSFQPSFSLQSPLNLCLANWFDDSFQVQLI